MTRTLLLSILLLAPLAVAQEPAPTARLIEALGDADHAHEAMARLQALGAAARPALVALLEREAPAATDAQARRIAAQAARLSHADVAEREAAGRALVALGPVAVPQLQRLAGGAAAGGALRKRLLKLLQSIDDGRQLAEGHALRRLLALLLFAELATPADAPLLRRQLAFGTTAPKAAVAADHALRAALGGGPAPVAPRRWASDPAAPSTWDPLLAAPPKPSPRDERFAPDYPAGPLARGVRLEVKLTLGLDDEERLTVSATHGYDLTRRDEQLVRAMTRHQVVAKGDAPPRAADAKGLSGKQLALSLSDASKDARPAGDELDQLNAPGHLLAFALPRGAYPAGRPRAMEAARVERLMRTLMLGGNGVIAPAAKLICGGSARWMWAGDGKPSALFVSYRAISLRGGQLFACLQQGRVRVEGGRVHSYQIGGALCNVPAGPPPRGGFIRPITFDVVGRYEHALLAPAK